MLRCVFLTLFSCAIVKSQLRMPSEAIAIIRGEYEGNKIEGVVKFEQVDRDTLRIDIEVDGFPKNMTSLHGIHVHEWGLRNVSTYPDVCNTAGPHFNPLDRNHGDIESEERHVGDFGLVRANEEGEIRESKRDFMSKLFGPLSIIGRTIVLHHDADDLGMSDNSASKITGNSGARIACGVIGIDKEDD